MIRIILKEARRPAEKVFDYDHTREKSDQTFFDKDICNTNDKVKNIINAYKIAPIEIKDFFSKWYETAGNSCILLAKKHGMVDEDGIKKVKAIVAQLSQGNTFRSNLIAADKFIENMRFGKNNVISCRDPATNVKKAERIWGGDYSSLTTPKISIFYQTLVDPKSTKEEIVLDGHALSIWLGKKVVIDSEELKPLHKKVTREIIKQDFLKAAKCLEIATHDLQAVTWAVWKNTLAAEKLAAQSGGLK